MKTGLDMGLIALVFGAMAVSAFIGSYEQREAGITSDHKIEPIVIIDGSDTTYVYKQ